MLGLFTAFGLITTAALAFLLHRIRMSNRFAAIAASHGSSVISSKAELVDGMTHIDVELTLERSQIFYENAELTARIDLDRIDEVEYDSELATGNNIARGKVLRLRSHGHAYEFILDPVAARDWSAMLPPHRMNEPGVVHAN